jgi:large subunit ribosomal protein L15
MRGSRLMGHAAKKHKGSGNQGGKGMSGSGKRSNQKKSFVIRYMFPYFGKSGYTHGKHGGPKNYVLNLTDIESNIETYSKNGEIFLPRYKILGEGEITSKLTIKAKSFSDSAKEKIEKSGGKAIVIVNGKEKTAEKASEKKAEKKEVVKTKVKKVSK